MSGPLADILAPAPALYTLAPGQPFLATLARTLTDRYRDDPLALSDITIFLPTRRAVRSLADAFLDALPDTQSATLLPSFRTLGDAEEEAFDPLSNRLDTDATLPVSPEERRIILAQFVHRWLSRTGAEHNPGWGAAFSGADALGQLLDSLYTEEVDPGGLKELVPERFAGHWQETIEFLDIVLSAWPGWLKDAGLTDPAAHRIATIDQLNAQWRANFPANPVIIAGSTGSMPAVARLMQTVAAAPSGAVILPGLDKQLDEAAWKTLEDAHPLAGLKALLETYFCETARTDIPDWPSPDTASQRLDRTALVNLALRPADATDDWRDRLAAFEKDYSLSGALEGVSLVEAADEDAEADAVALLFRETLEQPDKTAMLVTPDRMLARRVSGRLLAWGIRVDDSAGVPFANTPCGNFLRLTANWLENPGDPVTLLSMLKHRRCLISGDPADWQRRVALLDMALRGMPPVPDLAGIKLFLSDPDWEKLDEEPRPARDCTSIMPLLDQLSAILETWQHAAGSTFAERLSTHILAAEKLAGGSDPDGTSPLWQNEDGEAGARLAAALVKSAALLRAGPDENYTEIFSALISGTPVRFPGGGHPRLKILGPLEARLVQADRVILGGLNEGVWPDGAGNDPFLSRPMRASLGLPSPERRIGLAAHDFAQGSAAPEVILTRAMRVGRAPSQSSRWVVRLRNILDHYKLTGETDRTAELHRWRDTLHRPAAPVTIRRPNPKPPLSVRPTELSVTRIEKLIRDPYAIYAQKILHLRKLDPLTADMTLSLRGRFYHALFARFTRDWPNSLPADVAASLQDIAARLMDQLGLDAALAAFWRTDLDAAISWFSSFHREQMDCGVAAAVEIPGAEDFDIDGSPFRLTARLDRADILKDGSLAIFDYKTSSLPTLKQAKTFNPQLFLTALIAEAGGFAELGGRPVSRIAFLKILNRGLAASKNETAMVQPELGGELAHTRECFFKLIRHYRVAEHGYPSQPRPQFVDEYGDYDHLARRPEWSIGEEAAE